MSDYSSGDLPNVDKREEIIAEAIHLFNLNGYSDTRLEDIGARLGTVKTSVSYYFRSKEGLLEEVCDRALSFSETAIERAQREPVALDGLLGWLRVHAMAHADALKGIARPLALIGEMPVLAGSVDSAGSSIAARHSRLVGQCQALVERGVQDGSVRVASVPAALLFILNFVHWLPRWLAEIRPADTEIAIRDMLDILSRGLAADPNRPFTRVINRSSVDGAESVFNRAARNRAKREAFLRAGTRALNQTGYRSLSLNDVAAELGVTRGAFYYHIADKEALLSGCFERSLDLIQMAQTLASNDDIDGLGMLERSTRWLFERQVSNLDPLINLRLMSALDNASRQLVTSRLFRLRAGFGNMLAMGLRDGSVRPVDVATAEHLVFGAILACGHPGRSLVGADAGQGGQAGENISSAAYVDLLRGGLSGGRA